MLTAYLYNTQTQQLRMLTREELRDGVPSAQERQDKTKINGGIVPHGRAQCRDNEFIWVDMTAPDEQDFALLTERFDVHELVIEDVHEQEGRPKLHDYADELYLIFHALRRDDQDGLFNVRFVEIDCLVGTDYVLTLHAEPIAPFNDLQTRWKRHPAMMQSGPAYLLYELMDEVLDDYFPVLDAMDDQIDSLEDRLISGNGHSMTGEIFSLKRCLLEIRHITGPTRDVVNVLLRRDAENGGKHFAYFQDLYDHAVRIVDTVDTFRDILSGAMDAFLAAQGNRLNEVMKTMTAMSIILLVPNLIAAIYGMNFKYMPELETRNGYFVALGVMVTCVMGLIAYFKRIDWL